MTTSLRTVSNVMIGLLAAYGMAGCGGSNASNNGGGGGTTPVSGGATYVYTVQNSSNGPGQVLQFTAGANGSVSPLATLSLPAGSSVQSVATDATGQIYVGGYLGSGAAVIEVFAAGASGTATPVRTITLSSGYAPVSMTLDASGLLYTVDGSSQLSVYSATASGVAAPVRAILGTATKISYPSGVAVDSSGNVYVSEGVTGTTVTGAILVFGSTASGNVAPSRTITGANLFFGIALDASGNLYANMDVTTAPYSASIVEYAAGASGAATPVKTIAGSATGLTTAGGLRIDSAGNLYLPVETAAGTTYAFSLMKFTSAANGNVAPAAVMTSTAWNAAGSEIALK